MKYEIINNLVNIKWIIKVLLWYVEYFLKLKKGLLNVNDVRKKYFNLILI